MFQALRSSASTDSLGIDDAPEDCFVVFRAHGKTLMYLFCSCSFEGVLVQLFC